MRRLAALLGVAAVLVAPPAAAAHPLGNFTVNRYSAVELSGDRVYVHYVVDLAEIPTFQEGDRVRAPGFAHKLAPGLELVVDNRRRSLRPLKSRARARPGAGGLETLRFEAVYEAGATGHALRFRDRNFAGRLGWREVVVRATRGARIEAASVPSSSVSHALRRYPRDLLQEPLAVTAATARFHAGSLPGRAPGLGGEPTPEREEGSFESLIAQERLGLGVMLLSLTLAALWGAAHALTPGHGKAIVASYLVGTRGRPRDAVLLGMIVTGTHTIGVFALGVVTLLLSRFLAPERLYPWLTLASGLLIVAVGASVLRARLRQRRATELGRTHHHHHHHHHGGHERAHRRGGLLGVGIAAGLLPCPSALVVLLSAIALHRIAFGLALILAFSIGLAATITAIGLIAVLARRSFTRLRLDGPLVRALPAASALVIVVLGAGITLNALPETL
jgi:nickel/cobalt transporter (NicO) family protein